MYFFFTTVDLWHFEVSVPKWPDLDIVPVCLQRFAPSHSCLCRFELSPHHYLSRWVCRWFESRQRRLSADPAGRKKKKKPSTDFVKLLGSAGGHRDHWTHKKPLQEHSSACVMYLVPGDGAVYWVGVLKVVCFLHLVNFVLHSESLLHKGLVADHDLQILHHLTGCIYVYVLVVISEQKKQQLSVTE